MPPAAIDKRRLMKRIIVYFLGVVALFSTLWADGASVVILGSGPGGLTSAIYLARAGYDAIVVEGDLPLGSLSQSYLVQNWPGEQNISGQALMEKMHKQAELLGVKFLSGSVAMVDFSNDQYSVAIKNAGSNKESHLKADVFIIAMGCLPASSNIQGEREYLGKGVSLCAVCDGGLYKGLNVAVVGGGEAALMDAAYLSRIAKQVYLVSRGGAFKSYDKQKLQSVTKTANVSILQNTSVEKIMEEKDGFVLTLKPKSGQKDLKVDGVFLAVGLKPNTAHFKGQLALDEKGYIIVGADRQSSRTGIFAVGDITASPHKQAIVAAGDGAIAAMRSIDYLEKLALEKAAAPEEPVFQKIAATGLYEVSSAEEFNKMLEEAKTPVLVDFYASWCGPCRQIAPIYQRAAAKHAGKALFLKINVDKLPELAREHRIRAMPTMLVFLKGKKVAGRYKGADEIQNYLRDFKPH